MGKCVSSFDESGRQHDEKAFNESAGELIEQRKNPEESEIVDNIEDQHIRGGGDDVNSESERSACENESSSDDENNNNENDAGLSNYERLRLIRIKRNNERLAELGFSEKKNSTKRNKMKTPKPRKIESLNIPKRQLPERSGRATFYAGPAPCTVCRNCNGEMITCDSCKRSYHPFCHPLIPSSEGGFHCLECGCGQCSACKREDDCMTCVACSKSSKCIFRRCQGWRKSTLKRVREEANWEEENEDDNHDSMCCICNEGGDLICCDSCPRVFHSNCHRPRITSVPDGEWHCMYCQKSKTIREIKPSKQTGHLVAYRGGKVFTVTLKWPTMHCRICEAFQVTGAKLHPDWLTCCACHDCYHLQCLTPPLESKPSKHLKWRCKTCKEKKGHNLNVKKVQTKKYEEPQKLKEAAPLFHGVHDDDCYVCRNGGNLICCDYCSKVFHAMCHIPPLHAIPDGVWKCCECAAPEYKRMMKCGECEACVREDCGECVVCIEKKKFGGPGTKRRCRRKRCPYMRLAPPSSATDKLLSEEEVNEMFKAASRLTKKSNHTSEPNHIITRNDNNCLRNLPLKCGDFETSGPIIVNNIAYRCENLSFEDDPVDHEILTVINTASNQLKNAIVQKHACQYLRFFITSVENVVKIIHLKGLLMIAKAMNEYPDQIDVQAEAIFTLVKMAWMDPSCGINIVSSGCLSMSLESMKNFGMDDKVQQMGCALLRALSYDFRNHHLIYRIQGLESIAESLKRNTGKLEIYYEGCCFLQNMLCNTHRLQDTVRSVLFLKFIPIIVDGMVNLIESDCFKAACGVLKNLANDEDARRAIGNYGMSIKILLSSLEANIDLDTSKSALSVLENLVRQNEENSSQIILHDGLKKIIDFINRYSDDIISVASGLQLLIDLTRIRQKHMTKLEDAGGVRLIISQMNKRPHLPFIQVSGCSIFRVLCFTEVEDAEKSVRIILTALNNHRHNKTLQFEGCHALLNICSLFPTLSFLLQSSDSFINSRKCSVAEDEADSVSILFEDTIETNYQNVLMTIDYSSMLKDPVCLKIKGIVNMSLKQIGDHKIQAKACDRLRMIVKSVENAEKIIQLGGLDLITRGMKKHPDKAILQEKATCALAALIWMHPASSKVFLEKGCLPVILCAMKRHKHSAMIQEMGCGIFREISYENDNHVFINRVKGLDALVNTLIQNPKKYTIVQEVCTFLQNMLSNPKCQPGTADYVVSKGAIPIVVDGMTSNFCAEYVEAASGALSNLAIDKNARAAIGNHKDSINSIISVLVSGVSFDAGKCALTALKHLAMDNEYNMSQILEQDGIQKVISFVQSHPLDEDIVLSSFHLLMELIKCDHNEIYHSLENANVFEFITAELCNHPNSSSIQRLACDLLRSTIPVHNESNVEVAINLILASMKNHEEDSDIQFEGCRALLHLSSIFPSILPILQSEENYFTLSNSRIMLE